MLLFLIHLATIYGYIMGLGITVGCHRYWSHRTFKAKLPLQIFLALAQTAAGQVCDFIVQNIRKLQLQVNI